MMNADVLKVAAQIAGIGGIALIVFFYLNREVLRRNLFSSLTKQQSYRILQMILVSCCIVSLSGIGAWVFIEVQSRRPGNPSPPQPAPLPSWSSLQEISIDDFDVPYPGLEKFWPTFQESTWSGGITNGKYRLANATDPGAVQYIWVEMKVDASNLPVTADISFDDTKRDASLSAAGLLYRFDQDTRYYYAFCIDRDGRYSFYRRDGNGLNPVSSGQGRAADGKSQARLGIIGTGSELRLYVDNTLVKIVQDSALKNGLAGVVALGTGEFRFDNLAVYAAIDRPPP